MSRDDPDFEYLLKNWKIWKPIYNWQDRSGNAVVTNNPQTSMAWNNRFISCSCHMPTAGWAPWRNGSAQIVFAQGSTSRETIHMGQRWILGWGGEGRPWQNNHQLQRLPGRDLCHFCSHCFGQSRAHGHAYFFFFNYYYFFGHAAQLVGSWFPDQGLNPHTRQWKCGVLTTGPPGNSHLCLSLKATGKYNLARHLEGGETALSENNTNDC